MRPYEASVPVRHVPGHAPGSCNGAFRCVSSALILTGKDKASDTALFIFRLFPKKGQAHHTRRLGCVFLLAPLAFPIQAGVEDLLCLPWGLPQSFQGGYYDAESPLFAFGRTSLYLLKILPSNILPKPPLLTSSCP